jgi:hypothetical protein
MIETEAKHEASHEMKKNSICTYIKLLPGKMQTQQQNSFRMETAGHDPSIHPSIHQNSKFLVWHK